MNDFLNECIISKIMTNIWQCFQLQIMNFFLVFVYEYKVDLVCVCVRDPIQSNLIIEKSSLDWQLVV